MTKTIGFLKRSQKFYSNEKNRKYFPILDSLSKIASENRNYLPNSFYIEKATDCFSVENVKVVLKQLYPENYYTCKLVGNCIYCIRY